MNFKNFVFTLSLALLVLVAVSSVSAASLSHSIISVPANVSHNAGSFQVSFNLTNTGEAANITWDGSYCTPDSATHSLTTAAIGENQTLTFTATVTFPAYQSGSITGAFVANPSGLGSNEEIPFSVAILNSNALSIASTRDLTRTQTGLINVTNTGNQLLSIINLSFTGDINLSFSANNFALNAGASSLVEVTSLTSLNNSALSVGAHSATIIANNTATGTASNSISYSVNGDFCKYGNVNTSKIAIESIKEKSSSESSSNNWKWKPLDNVTIEVKVRNNFDAEEDFTVALGVYDTEKHQFVELTTDEDSNDIIEESVTIDDGHADTVAFQFKVPTDLADSDGRYVLYIKAYKDSKESTYCNSYSAAGIDSSADSIEITRKTHEVIIDDITAPQLVSAGETVRITAKAINIGTTDEDKVKAILTNTKLGLSVSTNPFTLDTEDSGDIDFVFNIPSNAEDGTYSFNIGTYYNYKNSDYRTASSTAWTATIQVVGGKPAATTNQTTATTAISASLQSEAKAGSEMTIKSTITNTAAGLASYTISARGYESWATLSSISERTFTLGAGQSKEVTFKFDVLDNASGENSFFIDANNGIKTESKEFAVNLASSSLFAKLKDSLGSNSIIWIIGLVNLILIILIIVAVIRVVRR